MIGQLCSLERRTARGGRDSVDHPPGQHDDLANACAGVAAALGTSKFDDYSWVGTDDELMLPMHHYYRVPIIR
jgi:hypothetical protein